MLQTANVEKIVVVGGGVARTNAAVVARDESKNVKITLIDQEDYVQYSRCGLPYLISEEIRDWKELIRYDKNTLRNINKIDIKI